MKPSEPTIPASLSHYGGDIGPACQPEGDNASKRKERAFLEGLELSFDFHRDRNVEVAMALYEVKEAFKKAFEL